MSAAIFAPAPPPDGRSCLHQALKDLVTWPEQDRRLFVESFMSHKSEPQIAHEMGMTPTGFRQAQRAMLRRFMRAADTDMPATASTL